jgi:hypothetical protein
MPASAAYTVTDPRAPRHAVAEDIKTIADQIAAAASANSPVVTGRLAGAYRVEQGDDPATSAVVNDTPYARFVEYGTQYMPAEAPLGRALAAARGGGR